MPYKDKDAARAFWRRRNATPKRKTYMRDYSKQRLKGRPAALPPDPIKFRLQAYTWRAANPEKYAYGKHKQHAKKRGVPFLLTFEEWWSIWDTSGKWLLRGHCRGQYVMARYGDRGGYEVGNVRICTCSENLAERNRLNPHLGKQRRRHD